MSATLGTPNRRTLLLGATGGIGRHVLHQLLDRGVHVTALVRNAARLARVTKGQELLNVIELGPKGHLALQDEQFAAHLRGCNTVVQCLGHNMSLGGVCGHPRRLCADTARRVCDALQAIAPVQPIKFIVCSTEGVDRPDGGDTIRRGCFERCLLRCLTCALPPHADNVDTARYLHQYAQNNPHVVFCAVRPSDLTDNVPVSEYTLHDTLQNGIFSPGSTSRANVAAFMADLVTDESLFERWENAFPHILDVPVPTHLEKEEKLE